MVCVTTTHLRERHNCDVNFPLLLELYQSKKNRRWIKLEFKHLGEYCNEIRVANGRRLGRPRGSGRGNGRGRRTG
jgi:hypothetical protein